MRCPRNFIRSWNNIYTNKNFFQSSKGLGNFRLSQLFTSSLFSPQHLYPSTHQKYWGLTPSPASISFVAFLSYVILFFPNKFCFVQPLQLYPLPSCSSQLKLTTFKHYMMSSWFSTLLIFMRCIDFLIIFLSKACSVLALSAESVRPSSTYHHWPNKSLINFQLSGWAVLLSVISWHSVLHFQQQSFWFL